MRGSLPLGEHVLQISILSSSCWHVTPVSCDQWNTSNDE